MCSHARVHLLCFGSHQNKGGFYICTINTYSDYAANKTDAEAIVCRSATGEDVRLTRADFESDEEFQRWKGWSAAD